MELEKSGNSNQLQRMISAWVEIPPQIEIVLRVFCQSPQVAYTRSK